MVPYGPNLLLDGNKICFEMDLPRRVLSGCKTGVMQMPGLTSHQRQVQAPPTCLQLRRYTGSSRPFCSAILPTMEYDGNLCIEHSHDVVDSVVPAHQHYSIAHSIP